MLSQIKGVFSFTLTIHSGVLSIDKVQLISASTKHYLLVNTTKIYRIIDENLLMKINLLINLNYQQILKF